MKEKQSSSRGSLQLVAPCGGLGGREGSRFGELKLPGHHAGHLLSHMLCCCPTPCAWLPANMLLRDASFVKLSVCKQRAVPGGGRECPRKAEGCNSQRAQGASLSQNPTTERELRQKQKAAPQCSW